MKKIAILLGFIVCTAFTANAQLKYQNGRLQFNAISNLDHIHPTADTRWHGNTHAFIDSTGAYFMIGFFGTPPITSPSYGTILVSNTSCVALWRDNSGYGFQDLYLEKVYECSDARVKTDIQTVSSATGTIMKLKPVTYRFINNAKFSKTNRVAGADGRDMGFIAQDVAQVLPNSVAVDQNGTMLVNYSSIIPLLVKTVQEQNARIEVLEKEIVTLKK